MRIEDREARLDDIQARQAEIHQQFEGQVLPDQERAEFESLAAEKVEHKRTIAELKARAEYLGQQSDREQNRESGAHFNVPNRVADGGDIYDLTTLDRSRGGHDQARQLRDRALKSIERMRPAHPETTTERAQDHVDGLLETIQNPLEDPGHFARYLLQMGSPVYERAWVKCINAQLHGRPPILNPEEQQVLQGGSRAASVGTTTAGGFAVPYTLDPTIIPTGNWSVNPWRAISRVEQISGSNEWRGVSAGDLTATRRAEAAEVTDNMVTLSQPTAIVSRVDAFVPFSYEIDQDWGSFRSEIAQLFSNAKDNEEASAFATGNGTAPNPQGVVTGATTVYTTAGTAAFVIGDLYGVKGQLPARFRPNATWVGEQAQFDRIRQFDTSGSGALWQENLRLPTSNDNVPTNGSIAANILGKPAYECSAMASTIATNDLTLVYGDFRYYLIVDRVGLNVEVIQNLFATPNNFPSGQRGLLAFWRNSAKVLAAGAFRTLKIK